MDHVVYFVSSPDAARTVEPALAAASRRSTSPHASEVRFHVETRVARALARLGARGADALVLDARGERGPIADSPALALLGALFDPHELGGPIGREQTWLVVDPDARGAALAFAAGRARIAGTIASGDASSPYGEIVERLVGAIGRRAGGKIAICLAGGGIEGLFYELGALRALQSFLPDVGVGDVDVLCGISAGAILGAFLANGMGPREIARGLQFGEGTIDRIGRADIFDPNVRELGERAASLARAVVRREVGPVSALWRLPPSGVFAGERLRAYLARQLSKPGMTDDFRALRRAFFVGATDQDTAEHEVFGGKGRDDVPISTAVRASAALTPFYAPQKIGDRHYVDGGFSRTTNMRVAVQAGATLVILIDPLVPAWSEQPGWVRSRGAVFGAAQGLKSLIHSRFDKATATLREMYPHVAFHIFSPTGATMKTMSGSPMKYFYRPGIEEMAYSDVVREIRAHRFDALARDFQRHDVRFVDPEADEGVIRRGLFERMGDVRVA